MLEDISLTGARVLITDRHGIDETPRAGASTVLEWFDYEVFGDVCWVAKDRLGIRFDEMVSPAVLIRTREIEDEHLAPRQAAENMRNYMSDWAAGRVR